MTIKEKHFEEWLAAYGAAWEAKDGAAFAGLFEKDALYYWTPFEDPQKGRDEIKTAFDDAVAGREREQRSAAADLAADPMAFRGRSRLRLVGPGIALDAGWTQDLERDPQMIPIGEHRWGFLYYASAVPYFQGILSGLLRQPFGRLNPAERRDVPPAQLATVVREARIFWCVYLALAAVSVHFESWLAVQLWLVPRVVGEPLMRVIRMSEHVGCARVPSMLANTRTVFTIAPLRLLAWNMAYHTAHHALPQAPFFRLGALDAVLRDHVLETRDGYVDFVRTHFRRMAAR